MFQYNRVTLPYLPKIMTTLEEVVPRELDGTLLLTHRLGSIGPCQPKDEPEVVVQILEQGVLRRVSGLRCFFKHHVLRVVILDLLGAPAEALEGVQVAAYEGLIGGVESELDVLGEDTHGISIDDRHGQSRLDNRGDNTDSC